MRTYKHSMYPKLVRMTVEYAIGLKSIQERQCTYDVKMGRA